MRLIDADKLLSWFDDHYDDETVLVGYVSGLIKDSPTIEPERKRGKWIDDCSCSVCHWTHEDGNGFALLTNYNYCPNCGARMDGESR